MTHPVLHPYVVTGYLTSAVTLVIGFFVYFKKRHCEIHRSFLIFSASVAQWSFCTAFHAMQEDPIAALLWTKLCHIGAMLIPVFFYYFTLKITGRLRPRSLRVGFVLASLLIFLNYTTPLFIPNTRQDVGPANFANAGPLYFLMIVFFSIYVLMSLVHLWNEINRSTGTRRKHLQYFFYASVVGFSLGVINFGPVYGITVWPFPYSAICGAIYEAVIAYAILRHKLFDIELIIKRGLVFGVLFGAVYAAVSALIFFAGFFMAGRPLAILSGASIALAMLLYEPLKGFLTRLTQRFLFQGKTDGLMLLQRLTDRLAGIRDAEALSREIVELLTREMALEWAGLYLKEEKQAGFLLRSAQGQPCANERKADDLVIRLAERSARPFALSPFDADGDFPSDQKARLRAEKIEAVVPIHLEGRLYGVLLLGKKKSDDVFTKEDEALFQTLADEAAMFFLSAKLLGEATRAQLELGQKMKMAAVTQLSRGVHHEIRNPLHAMVLAASQILENCQNGRSYVLGPLTPSAELGPRLEAMLEDIRRIKETLARFARFARPDEDFDPAPLRLKDEIGKFLVLMNDGQKLDRMEVHEDIPEDLRVVASEGALQEILFNLFNNAYDAMNGKGKLFLEASGADGWVEFRMRDTGPGIPPDILPRIFEPYFSTKSRSESAGIGLAITKHHIERLGGAIEAASLGIGKGAEFILRLPKAASGEVLRCA